MVKRKEKERRNKGSRLKIIEGGAHAMMMERPCYKVFRDKVLEFLKG